MISHKLRDLRLDFGANRTADYGDRLRIEYLEEVNGTRDGSPYIDNKSAEIGNSIAFAMIFVHYFDNMNILIHSISYHVSLNCYKMRINAR